jgi:DNA-binding FadR family transcriptional regulator
MVNTANGQTSTAAAAPEGRTPEKRAALLADQIVGDIAAAGWPAGLNLGGEVELLERYGVSRALLREAVRLLEHQQVAEMRKGRGGGLTVLEPTVGSVTDAVAVYLFYVRAEIDEVFAARLALEEMAARLAPTRMRKADREGLGALLGGEAAGTVANHRALHNLLAAASQNPALEFFVDLLNRVTLLYLPATTPITGSTKNDSGVAHKAIMDAVSQGNGELAAARMRKHLMAEADFLRARRPSRRRLVNLPGPAAGPRKRAEQVCSDIFKEVAEAGWPVGRVWGTEPELMARHEVSRDVFREAVRLLEHHQIVRMRRGRGGGLVVVEPDVTTVTDAVAVQVDRLGIEPAHLFELRSAIEQQVLTLVLDKVEDPVTVARLLAALETEEEATSNELLLSGHDLHAVLASASGNRVLELLVLVLLRLTRFHIAKPSEAPGSVPTGEVVHVHRKLVEAIVAGDRDLAHRRMRRHLDALTRWTR